MRALTQIPAAPDSIYADGDAGIATITAGGTTFRLVRGTPGNLRPCASCGTGQFASPSIASVADRALDGWRPCHDDYRPEDPASWLDREDN
mgnify:CR=1 FL=1